MEKRLIKYVFEKIRIEIYKLSEPQEIVVNCKIRYRHFGRFSCPPSCEANGSVAQHLLHKKQQQYNNSRRAEHNLQPKLRTGRHLRKEGCADRYPDDSSSARLRQKC